MPRVQGCTVVACKVEMANFKLKMHIHELIEVL